MCAQCQLSSDSLIEHHGTHACQVLSHLNASAALIYFTLPRELTAARLHAPAREPEGRCWLLLRRRRGGARGGGGGSLSERSGSERPECTARSRGRWHRRSKEPRLLAI
eukprot:SAG22_NODE_12607_length_436_cov_0.919881_1_plen_108_part_01